MAWGRAKIESGTADFSVFESSPPPGAKPPLHMHRSSDEAWYVIAGTVIFAFGAERSEREAGSFVFVPRGVVHSFANLGPGPARVLVIGSPQIAAMVEDAGRAGDVSAGTYGRLDILKRYDTDVVGPW
jgi:mannose-6-phosphate isomerase-like protein (cupin superfamily)